MSIVASDHLWIVAFSALRSRVLLLLVEKPVELVGREHVLVLEPNIASVVRPPRQRPASVESAPRWSSQNHQ